MSGNGQSKLKLSRNGNECKPLSSGVVQRARHIPSGAFLAIKVVQMNVQAEVRKNIIQELRTLHQSVCQYIVPYHGAFFSDGSISIILDYMDGGSLAGACTRPLFGST